MFGLINELSLIIVIDGAGCGEESMMGYAGLVIWIPLTFYLMAGQFVICEEYFVPILAQLGDRLNMAEDVQGATLLAVGSSSPELFTALLGAIFLPDDNPGPGTNVGSAVFNMCIIIGLSAIFAPRSGILYVHENNIHSVDPVVRVVIVHFHPRTVSTRDGVHSLCLHFN